MFLFQLNVPLHHAKIEGVGQATRERLIDAGITTVSACFCISNLSNLNNLKPEWIERHRASLKSP